MGFVRNFASLAAACAVWFASCAAGLAAKEMVVTASGLPVPRYVSLKSDHVNVRAGPHQGSGCHLDLHPFGFAGRNHRRVRELAAWCAIRKARRVGVYHSLLSGRRTAVVTMKKKDDLAPIYDSADSASAVAAKLQAGVVVTVKRCNDGWCRVAGTGFDGWIEQQRLWGVYADEKVN